MNFGESTALPTLAQTLTRLAELDENLVASIGAAELDSFSAAALLDTGSSFLQAALDRQAHEHPDMDARTKASYFIGEYVWYVTAPAIYAYLTEKRVPDLAPDNIALRFQPYTWYEGDESGEADRIEVCFLSTRCAVLPNDTLTSAPGVVTLPDAAALRQWMRLTLEAHLAPLIDRMFAASCLSRHALWLLAADSCAALFLHLGQQLGQQEEAMREGLAFVKASGSPMNNPKTGYVTINYNGHCETFRKRGGCCRYYTVSETGDDYCGTCVLRKPQDRDERLRRYMAHKLAQQETLA